MDITALFNLQYGVFILGSKDGSKINACITNTCMQVANEPVRVAISVINKNFTCDMIKKSGVFSLSILDKGCSYGTISHFGFQSGRDVDKFANFNYKLDLNGCPYITDGVCSVLSCKVLSSEDLGTHSLFIAEVIDAQVTSKKEAITYSYYHSDIKPKNNINQSKKIVAWRCKICRYIYEGSELPKDYICPLCGHGAEDFEPIYEGDDDDKNTKKSIASEQKEIIAWKCKICGYVYEGAELPDDYACPLCGHPKEDFEPIYKE